MRGPSYLNLTVSLSGIRAEATHCMAEQGLPPHDIVVLTAGIVFGEVLINVLAGNCSPLTAR